MEGRRNAQPPSSVNMSTATASIAVRRHSHNHPPNRLHRNRPRRRPHRHLRAKTASLTNTHVRLPTPTDSLDRYDFEFIEAFGGYTWDRPTDIAFLPDGESALIAEQIGQVHRAFLDARRDPILVFSIKERVSRASNEEGLLSQALDPNYEANGRVWMYYSVQQGFRSTRLFLVHRRRIHRRLEQRTHCLRTPAAISQPQRRQNHLRQPWIPISRIRRRRIRCRPAKQRPRPHKLTRHHHPTRHLAIFRRRTVPHPARQSLHR